MSPKLYPCNIGMIKYKKIIQWVKAKVKVKIKIKIKISSYKIIRKKLNKKNKIIEHTHQKIEDKFSRKYQRLEHLILMVKRLKYTGPKYHSLW